MDKDKKTIIIVLVIVLVLIFMCALLTWVGYTFYQYRLGIAQDVLPPDSSAEVCLYNGEVYEDGESFEAEDGCNTCYCDSEFGGVSCTEMYCGDELDEEIQDTILENRPT